MTYNILRGNEEFFALLDNLGEGVYVVNKDRRILFWNKMAEEITGYMEAEVVGKSCAHNILSHIDENNCTICDKSCPLLKVKKKGDVNEADLFLHHKKGHRIPVHVRSVFVSEEEGLVVEFFSDLSSLRSLEERVAELEEMAFFDTLTGISNRRYGEMQMEIRLVEQERHGWPFAFFMLDIDHFKAVNDTYGHDAGDQVLRMVAQTLNQNCRAYDLIVRWGGEEFVGMLRNVNQKQFKMLMEKFRHLIEGSFIMLDDDTKLSVTASFGGVLVDKKMGMDQIIKTADQKLYDSKKDGRNRVTLA